MQFHALHDYVYWEIIWKWKYLQKNISVKKYLSLTTHFVKTHYRGVFSRAAKFRGEQYRSMFYTQQCLSCQTPTSFKLVLNTIEVAKWRKKIHRRIMRLIQNIIYHESFMMFFCDFQIKFIFLLSFLIDLPSFVFWTHLPLWNPICMCNVMSSLTTAAVLPFNFSRTRLFSLISQHYNLILHI